MVVGIGYPVDGMEKTLNLRTRDYTPTNDTAFATYAASLWGNGEKPTPGGAPAFLRFIKEELKPFIEKNYPVDPADATLIGHSFGGLFATYALFHEPGTFQRFVIASPSLWWDHQVSLRYEKEYAAAHQDLAASVFLSVGGLETAAELKKSIPSFPEPMKSAALGYYDRNGWPEMVELIEPFGRTLAGRKYPSLAVGDLRVPWGDAQLGDVDDCQSGAAAGLQAGAQGVAAQAIRALLEPLVERGREGRGSPRQPHAAAKKAMWRLSYSPPAANLRCVDILDSLCRTELTEWSER